MNMKIKKSERIIITFTVMTIIITIIFITLGRYSNSLGGVAHASIAKPQTSLVSGGNNDITIDKGNIGEYRFYISNMDGSEISDVSMSYTIDVETDAGYGGTVRYSLFHSNESGIYDEATDAVSVNQSAKIVGATDERMVLPPTVETSQHFVLKFNPDTVGDFGFKVKVTAVQKD